MRSEELKKHNTNARTSREHPQTEQNNLKINKLQLKSELSLIQLKLTEIMKLVWKTHMQDFL